MTTILKTEKSNGGNQRIANSGPTDLPQWTVDAWIRKLNEFQDQELDRNPFDDISGNSALSSVIELYRARIAMV